MIIYNNRDHTICGLLGLASFIEHNIFKFHPSCTLYQYFIPFYGWIIFHYMDKPHFVYPYISWRTVLEKDGGDDYTAPWMYAIITCISQLGVTKYQRLGCLNNTNVFFSQFQRLEIQDQDARVVSGATSLSGLQRATSHCVLMWPFLCALRQRGRALVSSSSCKDTSTVGLGLYSHDLIQP